MNITFKSDKALEVIGTLEFLDPYTPSHLRTVLQHQFKVFLSGRGPAIYTVVGRTPHELSRMYLEYSGLRYEYPILVRSNGDLEDIQISGGRDHWSQLLRDKALESPIGSTTPGDISPYSEDT